jgi:hypothetical protein
MSPKIVDHMRWHQSHDAVDRVMVYPSDDEACKHFNSVHLHFLDEPINMCFGLFIDGFDPFRSFIAPYFYWPVILMVYNLFLSPITCAVDGLIVYPFDDEACKHFNSVHLHFSDEPINMCFGLFIDGFDPFRSFIAPYFYWPVIIMVYNLPSRMCMRLEFIFLSTIIPDPNSLGWNIDVCPQ